MKERFTTIKDFIRSQTKEKFNPLHASLIHKDRLTEENMHDLLLDIYNRTGEICAQGVHTLSDIAPTTPPSVEYLLVDRKNRQLDVIAAYNESLSEVIGVAVHFTPPEHDLKKMPLRMHDRATLIIERKDDEAGVFTLHTHVEWETHKQYPWGNFRQRKASLMPDSLNLIHSVLAHPQYLVSLDEDNQAVTVALS